jgi:hypothetical protein
VQEVFGDRVRDRLKNVKTGLESILEMLSKDVGHETELRLVAPVEPKKKAVAKPKGMK